MAAAGRPRRTSTRGTVARQVGVGGWRSMVVAAAAAARLREGGREEEQLRVVCGSCGLGSFVHRLRMAVHY